MVLTAVQVLPDFDRPANSAFRSSTAIEKHQRRKGCRFLVDSRRAYFEPNS
jgi:hypothetical protein